ncbi:MAG: hypothetical protein AAF993_05430 [Pseudomonadota bacterium]
MSNTYQPRPGLAGKLQQIKQFGFWRTCLASLLVLPRRWVEFEICQVAWSHNINDYGCPEGFDMQMVQSREEFAQWADAATQRSHERAFASGDICVVTLHDNQLVGYNFYSSSATPVNSQVKFLIGGAYTYSYGAFTHPDYRGLGLSPARWTFARNWRLSQGRNHPTIYYIALNNLASLSSGSQERRLIGYTGYLRLPVRKQGEPHTYCFRSPGCKRNQVGFVRA